MNKLLFVVLLGLAASQAFAAVTLEKNGWANNATSIPADGDDAKYRSTKTQLGVAVTETNRSKDSNVSLYTITPGSENSKPKFFVRHLNATHNKSNGSLALAKKDNFDITIENFDDDSKDAYQFISTTGGRFAAAYVSKAKKEIFVTFKDLNDTAAGTEVSLNAKIGTDTAKILALYEASNVIYVIYSITVGGTTPAKISIREARVLISSKSASVRDLAVIDKVADKVTVSTKPTDFTVIPTVQIFGGARSTESITNVDYILVLTSSDATKPGTKTYSTTAATLTGAEDELTKGLEEIPADKLDAKDFLYGEFVAGPKKNAFFYVKKVDETQKEILAYNLVDKKSSSIDKRTNMGEYAFDNHFDGFVAFFVEGTTAATTSYQVLNADLSKNGTVVAIAKGNTFIRTLVSPRWTLYGLIDESEGTTVKTLLVGEVFANVYGTVIKSALSLVAVFVAAIFVF